MLLVIAVMSQTAIRSSAYDVYDPPGNIVQNGNFQSIWADWSGLMEVAVNWDCLPDNYCGFGCDIYQMLRTQPGEQYSLTFYAAADLIYGPSVSLTVALSGTTLASFATPPYTYNPDINGMVQMQWQEMTYSFTAINHLTRLEFVEQNTYDFGLAAVSVAPVPEPGSFTFILACGIAAAVVRRRCR